MSTAVATPTEIRPFQIEIPDEQIDDLRRRIAATRLPTEGTRPRPFAGRAAGDDPGACPLLDDRVRLRLASGRG